MQWESRKRRNRREDTRKRSRTKSEHNQDDGEWKKVTDRRAMRKKNRTHVMKVIFKSGCGCSGKCSEVPQPPGLEGSIRDVMGLKVEEDDACAVIPITIDSGAVDTVGPRTAGGGFPHHAHAGIPARDWVQSGQLITTP